MKQPRIVIARNITACLKRDQHGRTFLCSGEEGISIPYEYVEYWQYTEEVISSKQQNQYE